MTSVGEAASVAPATQKSRVSRSLGSRFGSLFSSRSAHTHEPQIELDEPYRFYSRGDVVKGKVVLNVAKSLGITHLTVSLFGYVEVFKHHSKSKSGLRANPIRVASGKGKRWVTEYYGDGFASLFEHEATLCGGGRLDANVYHFQFEMPFPSDRDLPSSIEFERGVVAYGIAATITRPVTINPTVTASHPIKYRQTIDVASLRPPQPRKISLEPIGGHGKPKAVRRLTSTSNGNDRRSSSLSNASNLDQHRRAAAAAAAAATRSISEDGPSAPQSPLPSAPSSVSVSSNGAKGAPAPSESRSSQSSQDACATASQASSCGRPIIASVQLSRAGALPGGVVAVVVQIQHTKAVKSLYGVVATLYRQARVDMHPNLPVASEDNPRKGAQSEDYYPRSKSGLGGLSLSAAGSSQVWRKDLSQAISPLYVDENTMTAVVRPVIRVPEDAFATLANAPGEMIAFRYFIEVVIDINGKLAGRHNSVTAETASIHSTPQSLHQGYTGDDVSSQHLATESATFYQPPMTKGVVKVSYELVIGTHDSAKLKGKETLENTPKPTAAGAQENDVSLEKGVEQLPSPMTYVRRNADNAQDFHEHHDFRYDNDYELEQNYYDYNHDDFYNSNAYSNHRHMAYSAQPHTYPLAPPLPADFRGDSQLSEKERLQIAERTLLPSSPPAAEQASVAVDALPSAPFIPNESRHVSYEDWQAVGDSDRRPHSWRGTTPTVSPRTRLDGVLNALPPDAPAPSYSVSTEERAASGESSTYYYYSPSTDDKQELERHRLQGLATAPGSDLRVGSDANSMSITLPSAPPISAISEDAAIFDVGDEHASAPPEEILDTRSAPDQTLPNHPSHSVAEGQSEGVIQQ